MLLVLANSISTGQQREYDHNGPIYDQIVTIPFVWFGVYNIL